MGSQRVRHDWATELNWTESLATNLTVSVSSWFWIIFTIINRNSLSGRFPISSCLVWWVFILFLYLLGIPLSLHLVYIVEFGVVFLYSGSLWSFLYCGVSSLWVRLYGRLVKVSWLGKLVFWWVELDFFSLECNEVSSNDLWAVNGFGVTLGSILKLRAVFLCCWRICVVCLTLELVGP